jgi:hypothetical protein
MKGKARHTEAGDKYGGSAPSQPAALEYLKAQLAKTPAPYPSPDIRKIPSTQDIAREIEDRRSYQPKRRHELCEKNGNVAIVQFLRLADDPIGVTTFRKDWPNYFPARFWEEVLLSDEELYGKSGVQGSAVFLGLPAELPETEHRKDCTGCERCTPQGWQQRPTRGQIPFWKGYRDLLRTAWVLGFPNEYIPRLLNVLADEDDIGSKAPVIDVRHLSYAQLDILTLLRESWRAKVCNWCHLPFIPPPDKPAQQFCPAMFFEDPRQSCSQQFRRVVKLENWHKKKAKYRPLSRRKHGAKQ